MIKMLSTLSLIGMLAFSPIAMAQTTDLDSLSHKERKEKIQAMSAEERDAYFADRKAQWDAKSKEEKLKVIEERRAERMKKYEDKWNAMSDDEKIAHVEKKMKRWEEKAKNGDFSKGKHRDGDDSPHHSE